MTDITLMGFGDFLKLLAKKLFRFLSWPSFTLVYTLYASVRAIESDCPSKNKRCLCYWVLFALLAIWETVFAEILRWLPLWPYTRGIITLFLIIPSFGGSYVYKKFIKSCILENSVIWKWIAQTIDSVPRGRGLSSTEEEESIDDEVEKNDFGTQLFSTDGHIIYETGLCSSMKENSEVRYEVVKNQSQVQQLGQKRVQKEWCCALCLVITTSKKCLKTHLHGKKHKAKEEELRISKQAKKSRNRYSPISFIESSNRIRLLDYLNQIAEDSIIFPVARSCVWKKPGYGWTKLNTDGSMTDKRAGLGGLLRDYNGDPICAFVTIAPRDDIFSVELWAIWRGLVLALGLGIKVIWIESDSMSAVKTVDKKGSFGEKSLTCLNHIWEILDKFDDYKISHSWRETNRAADHLAKMVVLGSDDEVLWPVDFPPNLLNIIKDDAKGKIYHRGT